MLITMTHNLDADDSPQDHTFNIIKTADFRLCLSVYSFKKIGRIRSLQKKKCNHDISRIKNISVIHLYVSVCINKDCSQTNIFSIFLKRKFLLIWDRFLSIFDCLRSKVQVTKRLLVDVLLHGKQKHLHLAAIFSPFKL